MKTVLRRNSKRSRKVTSRDQHMARFRSYCRLWGAKPLSNNAHTTYSRFAGLPATAHKKTGQFRPASLQFQHAGSGAIQRLPTLAADRH
jgi:hypothetical protein